jgi:hypothetical protein
MLLHRFEIHVTDESSVVVDHPQVPPVEVNLPSPAAMRPVTTAMQRCIRAKYDNALQPRTPGLCIEPSREDDPASARSP